MTINQVVVVIMTDVVREATAGRREVVVNVHVVVRLGDEDAALPGANPHIAAVTPGAGVHPAVAVLVVDAIDLP